MSRCRRLVCAVIGAMGWLSAGAASATPVTYSLFAYTDISLNGRMFHDAAVTMTFTGDTADVQPFCVPMVSPCDPKTYNPGSGGASGWQISKGSARVRIVSGGRTYHANFLPNQIMISYDLYNGGAGFSSMLNGNFEAAYPFTVDGATIFVAPDLVTNGVWSGHTWSCIGFPPAVHNTVCGDPTAHPLATDAGPLVVFQTYQEFSSPAQTAIVDDYAGSLNSGFFSTLVGDPDAPDNE